MLQFTAYCFAEEVYIFLFLLECLRWGPTSLQTVMRNVIEHLQFVRSWGPEIKIKKHILLLEINIVVNGKKRLQNAISSTNYVLLLLNPSCLGLFFLDDLYLLL